LDVFKTRLTLRYLPQNAPHFAVFTGTCPKNAVSEQILQNMVNTKIRTDEQDPGKPAKTPVFPLIRAVFHDPCLKIYKSPPGTLFFVAA
jgi:hypothetical protein